MSDFRKCSICGSIFNFMGRDYCPRCGDDLEEGYLTVRDYLDDHPGATMIAIVEDTGLSEKLVMKLMDEGRLTEMSGGAGTRPASGKVCQMCKKPIAEGSICEACARRTVNILAGEMKGQDIKNSDKNADDNRRRQRMYTREDGK